MPGLFSVTSFFNKKADQIERDTCIGQIGENLVKLMFESPYNNGLLKKYGDKSETSEVIKEGERSP